VILPLHRQHLQDRIPDERTQRVRSFMLLAAGAAVALAVSANNIEVYENGIEVFNFPLYRDFVPGGVSRAMHPILLLRMSRFLSALSGSEFEVVSGGV
jgi:hypothetical protein